MVYATCTREDICTSSSYTVRNDVAHILFKSNIVPLRDLSEKCCNQNCHGLQQLRQRNLYKIYYMVYATCTREDICTSSSYTVRNDVAQILFKSNIVPLRDLSEKCCNQNCHGLQRATATKSIQNMLHGICNMHT